MRLTIEIKRKEDCTTLKIVGSLDTITAPVFKKTMRDSIGDTQNLILDLSGLEEVSDAGVSAILEAQSKMQRQGSLRAIGVRKSVRDVFERTGVVHILTIE